MDFKTYDVLIFLEQNTSNKPSTSIIGTTLLYKFTCFQYTNYERPAMDIFTTYDNSKVFGANIEVSVEADNVGYNSNQLPNGYINESYSLLKKVVVKQKTTSLSIAAIRAVLIPYVEAD